jgi:molecular chaperone DnaK
VGNSVGVDLGTTYSLAATFGDTGVRLHETDMGRRSTPSVVLINGTEIDVGEEAKHASVLYPDRTFAFFKRDMGLSAVNRTVEGHEWTPAQLSAEVLKSLAADVERETSERPTRAVITVPAYFGDAARRATAEAGRLAGLEVLELIHEPTAAALAFGFGRSEAAGQNLLVYDLGGGTFDVSLVRLEGMDMSVIATEGDHELGGKDWDDVLIDIVAERCSERHGIDPRWDLVAVADLRERCEDAKRSLSKVPQTTVAVISEGVSDRIAVTREEFEALSEPLLARTETLLAQVLEEAKFGWKDIDSAILVGGSTRMPSCAALVERISGRSPTRGIDPDVAVVHGAALVAARHDMASGGAAIRTAAASTVAGGSIAVDASGSGSASAPGSTPGSDQVNATRGALSRLPNLRDVTAHALGFVVISEAGDRYVNEVMIQRNASIPATQMKVKRLQKNITDLDVYVLQGHQERPLATESLGRYHFAAVPGANRDRDVTVSFSYDRDGIVHVRANVEGRELTAPTRDPDDRDLSWTDEDPRDQARRMLDVVLLIDCSSSMAGRKLSEAKDACADFAKLIGGLAGARVALVSFASGAHVNAPLTEDAMTVQGAARELHTYGSTDLAAGLQAATTILEGEKGRRVIVVVTDGAPNDASSAQAAARTCDRQEIEIVTIGVTGADMAFLASISTADRDSIVTDDMRGALHSIARSLAGGMARQA